MVMNHGHGHGLLFFLWVVVIKLDLEDWSLEGLSLSAVAVACHLLRTQGERGEEGSPLHGQPDLLQSLIEANQKDNLLLFRVTDHNPSRKRRPLGSSDNVVSGDMAIRVYRILSINDERNMVLI